MARGYPDYFGQRSVPKYGTPFIYNPGMVNAIAGATTSMLIVLGQGTILNILEHIDFVGDMGLTSFISIIDNVETYEQTIENMFIRDRSAPSGCIYRLLRYEQGPGSCTVESQLIIPFSIKYELRIKNLNAIDNQVYPEVFYYLQQ